MDQIFDFCRKSSKFNVPIIVMTYANPLLFIGIDKFCDQLKEAGVLGLIVPDLPFDSKEGQELYRCSKKYNLNLIQVVSPPMSKDRLHEAIKFSSEIIYCTTKRGTTGGKIRISKDLNNIVSQIYKASNLTIAIGFGISTIQDTQQIMRLADIAVIGSVIIRKYNDSPKNRKLKEVGEFLKTLINS